MDFKIVGRTIGSIWVLVGVLMATGTLGRLLAVLS